MEFAFKLPDGWTYRERPDHDDFEFWMEEDPEHRFCLTKTALALYGDNVPQLAKIINMQMEMLEASKAARSMGAHMVEAGTGHEPPGTKRCTTPAYCHWAVGHLNRPYTCYCGMLVDYESKEARVNKQRRLKDY